MSEKILTQQELQAIRARAEKVPAEPWVVDNCEVVAVRSHPDEDGVIMASFDTDLLEFVASSRADIPRLLFTVERYKEALEFYGDVFNWGHPLTDGQGNVLAGCFLPGDNGERARQVLAITADKRQE